MKKATRIAYDPYSNRIQFQVSASLEGPWDGLTPNSPLLHYENEQVMFSNCVSDVVETIDDMQNSSREGLEIQFVGPESDYRLLQLAIQRVNAKSDGAKGSLNCKHVGMYRCADDVLAEIKADYEKVANEFTDYLPGGERYVDGGKRIGDGVVRFVRTVDDEVPVCIIGNYSVGKSALINALIGDEVLPSKENPSTAKNVKVVRSHRRSITVQIEAKDEASPFDITFVVEDGSITCEKCELASYDAERACFELSYQIGASSKSASTILYALLDGLNDGSVDRVLGKSGWNVVVETPFANPLFDQVESRIVLYDTPGSNNALIDQASHRNALEDLMGEQTNALPVLVALRGTIAANDNKDVINLLDDYSENFASPSCIVVFSQCDLLTATRLEEPVPSRVARWHGRSTILFTTPLGALGERKEHNAEWLDADYRDTYEKWKDSQHGPKRIVLPRYNVVPCEGRGTFDAQRGAVDDLYASGIPSLEEEIVFYIENYANYKKCVRGRKDLLDALSAVRSELDARTEEVARKRREAQDRKGETKRKLLVQLDRVWLPELSDAHVERLLDSCSELLESYCRSLPQVMDEVYGSVSQCDPLEMDDKFNAAMKRHCETHLIKSAYEGPNGVRDKIVELMTEFAERYASCLQEFVSSNDSHFSEYGRDTLSGYLERELHMPRFHDVPSALGVLSDLVEKVPLVEHEILKLAGNASAAKSRWIDAKRRAFTRKLRERTNVLGQRDWGLFARAVIIGPLEGYYEQLARWAGSYRSYIKGQLDDDNVILSGLESEIMRLDAERVDLANRLENLSEVERSLSEILEEFDLPQES